MEAPQDHRKFGAQLAVLRSRVKQASVYTAGLWAATVDIVCNQLYELSRWPALSVYLGPLTNHKEENQGAQSITEIGSCSVPCPLEVSAATLMLSRAGTNILNLLLDSPSL